MSTEESLPPPAPTSAAYEFGPEENRVFLGLARKARSVGFWFIIYGAILLISFVVAVLPLLGLRKGNDQIIHVDLGNLVSGLIFLCLGIWSRRSAREFAAVARTTGSDVGHLMGALKDLSRLYGLLDRIIFVVVLILVLLMIVTLIGTFTR